MKKFNAARPTRRRFLKGLGGAFLALPLLPSLFPEDLYAVQNGIRHFIAMGTTHGGVWSENMYPEDETLSNTQGYKGINIKQGNLVSSIRDGDRFISPTLRAPEGMLTEALVGKMNVMRGIGYPFYFAHHGGGHLGNIASNSGIGTDGALAKNYPSETIDQYLASSDNFYPDVSGIIHRSIHFGRPGMSHRRLSNGNINQVESSNSSLTLFGQIFKPSEVSLERRVVDDVQENYRRLLNQPLSNSDRVRLVEHVERIDELQRRLNVVLECTGIQVPTDDSGNHNADNPVENRIQWQLINDVIATAMACDTSRIATMWIQSHFTNYSGDWHEGNAHRADNAGGQPTIVNSNRNVFKDVFVDLISKLDSVMDADGNTLLDNSLVTWTQESGQLTHTAASIPIVTAGGLCGAFSTGNYIDYSNRNINLGRDGIDTNPGLIYNQWLGNILLAMGEDPVGFETGDRNAGGWGPLFVGASGRFQNAFSNQVRGALSEKLPYLFNA